MRRILVLLTAFFLAGCAAGATSSPTATPTPTPGAIATAAPSAGPSLQVTGSTVQVPTPTGVDDTANIQAALDWCVAHGPGCAVQLQAGTYKSSLLVAYNFRGTFKGAGEGKTTIQALPHVVVNWPDFTDHGQCPPNLTDCRWASFIVFVDGSIKVSDLVIDFPVTNGDETTPYTIGGNKTIGFTDAIKFLGDGPTDVSVDRVSVTGRHDTTATNPFGWGYNVLQGIYFAGDLPSAPYLCGKSCQTYATLSGSFAVRNSSVKSIGAGLLASGANVASSQVTIGGSPTAANQIDDVFFGIDLGGSKSVFDVSYNVVTSATYYGVLVEGSSLGVPWSSPSQVEIHDNKLGTGAGSVDKAAGIKLQDDSAKPWIQAKIRNNTITLLGLHSEGIAVENSTGAVISGNTITGAVGYEAIGLYGATHSSLTGNNVSGFKPDPTAGHSEIYLNSAASYNDVTCSSKSNTVLDQGAHNTITGCTRS